MSNPYGARPGIDMTDITKLLGVGQSVFGSVFGNVDKAVEPEGYKHPLDLTYRDKIMLGETAVKVKNVGEPDDLGLVDIELDTGGEGRIRVPIDAKLRVA